MHRKINIFSKPNMKTEIEIKKALVHVEGDALRIENLTIDEPKVVAYFRDVEPDHTADAAHNAVVAGVALLSGVKYTNDLTYVENQMREMLARVEVALHSGKDALMAAVDARFDPRVGGSHASAMAKAVEAKKAEVVEEMQRALVAVRTENARLTDQLAERFDPKRKDSYLARAAAEIESVQVRLAELFDQRRTDSIPAKLREQLDSVLGKSGALELLLDKKLSLSDPSSPLHKIAAELAELKTEVAKQQALQVLTDRT